MRIDMLVQLLPGLAFLMLASTIVAIPFAIFIKHKPLAVFLSVLISTLILKLWAYFTIGGFDVEFLVYLLVVGLLAAVSVNAIVAFIRGRFVKLV